MFELGSIYPASLNVLDTGGNLTNAATVNLTVTQPDQTVVSCPVTNPPAAAGQYTYNFPTVQPGRHLVNWVTAGPVTAYTDVFDVLTAAPPAIISLADAKQTLQMDPAWTGDDDELRTKLRAVTTSIERYMRTVYAYRSVTETFQRPVMGVPWAMSSALRLTYVPVIALTSLVTVSQTNTVTTTYDTVNDLWTDAETGLVHRNNGPPLAGRMQAAYTAGMAVIPENVLEGGRVLLQSIWESRRGPGGVGGVLGPEELSDWRHFTGLPRKVMDLLGPPRPVVY